VIISAADSVTVSADKLCSDVAAQVSRQLGLPAPRDAICVNEKRATFQCTPDRPAIDHGSVAGHPLPPGLLLAGDYCTARYPATLESAVLSGRAAAQQIIGSAPG
jgi:predicted NAD/FAD-dependent oxidoreductase